MINFLKKLFSKEDWRLVGTLTQGAAVTSRGIEKDTVTVYVHMFESSTGRRRVDYSQPTTSISAHQVTQYMETTDLYNTRIYPWLSGRVDPEILRYNDVPEAETAAMLRGKR